MNILPKKSWHVRNKDNIARVRKDEAAAQEEELKRIKRAELAETQSRLNYLRKNAVCNNSKATVGGEEVDPSVKVNEVKESSLEKVANPSHLTGEHINLFKDFKDHVSTTNKLHEKEKKDEKEKYEKQIGYLTYLGQDTNEALKLKSWYELAPKRSTDTKDAAIYEKDLKNKVNLDPLTLIRALLPKESSKPKTNNAIEPKPVIEETQNDSGISKYESMGLQNVLEETKRRSKHSKKHKKEHRRKGVDKHKKKRSKCMKRKRLQEELEAEEEYRLRKAAKLEQLRKERLQREAVERERRENLLAPKKPATDTSIDVAMNGPRIVQRYNSQFNPEIAKQNMH